jgi:hypothetical protein
MDNNVMREDMDSTLSNLFVRYLFECQRQRNVDTRLTTAALFLTDDCELGDCMRSGGDWLDADLIDEVLKVASPLEIGLVLRSSIGFRLAPEVFANHFFRAIDSSSDFLTYKHLGGAAKDYLRHHPEAFDIPNKLVDILLGAPDADARWIGLRLLGQLAPADSRVPAAILAALESFHSAERLTGMNVFRVLLERQNLGARLISQSFANEVLAKVEELKKDQDLAVRDTAKSLASFVVDIASRTTT